MPHCQKERHDHSSKKKKKKVKKAPLPAKRGDHKDGTDKIGNGSAGLATWDTEEVCVWFESIVRLPQYVANLEEMNVSGATGATGAWLSAVTNEALHKDLGVTSKVHRKKILQQVAEQLSVEANPEKPEVESAAESSHDLAEPPPKVNVAEDEENVVVKKKPVLFVCKYSGKKFKSKGQYENHLRSKKYRALEKKAADAAAAAVAEAAETGCGEQGEVNREAFVGEGVADDTEVGSQANRGVPGACGGVEYDSDSSEEWFDEDTPWVSFPKESIFDAHQSKSFEANIDYMSKAHSFHIPYKEYLVDERGLFAYLQAKVCLYHSCVYCKMAFESLEACQNHMTDKSHKKVNFEHDYGALELAKFYDFHRGGEADADAAGPYLSAHNLSDTSVGGELMLASGARLGNRSLKQYYKQNPRISDQRVSVRINQRIQYENARQRFGGLYSKIAQRRERNLINGVLVKGAAFANGNSKAISSQFVFKQGAADNAQNRAIVHHWGGGGGGSHYWCAGSKQFQKGNKLKGVVSRHSRQAAIRNGKKSQAKKSSGTAVLQ